MHIVLNNPVLYVVDYPSVGAIEVIDKRRARGVLLAGDTALRFRRELEHVMRQSDDADDFDVPIGRDLADDRSDLAGTNVEPDDEPPSAVRRHQ